jgi:hypothetical protein
MVVRMGGTEADMGIVQEENRMRNGARLRRQPHL